MPSKAPLIQRNSRLRFGEFLLEEAGFDFWDILDLPEIPEQVDDIRYQVKTFDRIDLLASRFYGDPVLWWVIAVVNDMELLPVDLIEGSYIRIPSPRFVSNGLFNIPIRRF